MSRPSDHIDAGRDGFESRDTPRTPLASPLLSALRGLWTWLTSMRTALLLLLLLAIAAVPGSLVPQRVSDPNGVTQYFAQHPDTAPFLDSLQVFDVYSSWWFSAIYLLLFISLIGCVIPRMRHHFTALRARPPRTPARLQRLGAYATLRLDSRWQGREGEIIAVAHRLLRRRRYRAVIDETPRGMSVAAERGYLRETGNLVFHAAMLLLICAVGGLSGFNWQGQRVLVESQTFANGMVSYSSFTPGRFFSPSQLPPFALTLDTLDVTYETQNPAAIGTPLDYSAHVTVQQPGKEPQQDLIRVNAPLRLEGMDTYLLANGYAPTITVRDPEGRPVFEDSVPFIPQDNHLTSTGVVKVPDGLAEQVGLMGFFYPTAAPLPSGALTSVNQDLLNPELTLNVYTGDLGLDDGIPSSVFMLDTDTLTQVAGGSTGVSAITLSPGQTQELPNGLGTITMDAHIPRYASFDVHRDYTRLPVAISVALAIAGLIVSLMVPRRRMWVRARPDGDGLLVEIAGLARGEDPRLARAVNDLVDVLARELVSLSPTTAPPQSPPPAKAVTP